MSYSEEDIARTCLKKHSDYDYYDFLFFTQEIFDSFYTNQKYYVKGRVDDIFNLDGNFNYCVYIETEFGKSCFMLNKKIKNKLDSPFGEFYIVNDLYELKRHDYIINIRKYYGLAFYLTDNKAKLIINRFKIFRETPRYSWIELLFDENRNGYQQLNNKQSSKTIPIYSNFCDYIRSDDGEINKPNVYNQIYIMYESKINNNPFTNIIILNKLNMICGILKFNKGFTNSEEQTRNIINYFKEELLKHDLLSEWDRIDVKSADNITVESIKYGKNFIDNNKENYFMNFSIQLNLNGFKKLYLFVNNKNINVYYIPSKDLKSLEGYKYITNGKIYYIRLFTIHNARILTLVYNNSNYDFNGFIFYPEFILRENLMKTKIPNNINQLNDNSKSLEEIKNGYEYLIKSINKRYKINDSNNFSKLLEDYSRGSNENHEDNQDFVKSNCNYISSGKDRTFTIDNSNKIDFNSNLYKNGLTNEMLSLINNFTTILNNLGDINDLNEKFNTLDENFNYGDSLPLVEINRLFRIKFKLVCELTNEYLGISKSDYINGILKNFILRDNNLYIISLDYNKTDIDFNKKIYLSDIYDKFRYKDRDGLIRYNDFFKDDKVSIHGTYEWNENKFIE